MRSTAIEHASTQAWITDPILLRGARATVQFPRKGHQMTTPTPETQREHWPICDKRRGGCSAGLSPTDFEVRRCTNCNRRLTTKEIDNMNKNNREVIGVAEGVRAGAKAISIPAVAFNTSPLERSEWSMGRGDNFIYFDFDFVDGKAALHCVYDFNGEPLGNVTADLEYQVVNEHEAAQWASDMVNRAVQWFRETVHCDPRPIKSARAFIRAVQQTTTTTTTSGQ